MKEMKLSDLDQMLQTSAEKAVVETRDVFSNIGEVEITIQDEDGNEYHIQDVVFDPESGTVAIKFNHDND
jgi:hypothetical protein